jgi:hypothetical protein
MPPSSPPLQLNLNAIWSVQCSVLPQSHPIWQKLKRVGRTAHTCHAHPLNDIFGLIRCSCGTSNPIYSWPLDSSNLVLDIRLLIRIFIIWRLFFLEWDEAYFFKSFQWNELKFRCAIFHVEESYFTFIIYENFSYGTILTASTCLKLFIYVGLSSLSKMLCYKWNLKISYS